MKDTTLKQTFISAAEFYERQADRLKIRAERMTDGSNIQKETREAYQFNRGRAKAMREAIEFLEDYLG